MGDLGALLGLVFLQAGQMALVEGRHGAGDRNVIHEVVEDVAILEKNLRGRGALLELVVMQARRKSDGDGHACSLPGHCMSDGPANAASGAGDEHGFP